MADKSTEITDDLARVGTSPASVPHAPPQKRGWLGRRARPASEGVEEGSGPGVPSSGKWAPSAKEELERFKGAPVIGGLPWRTQYLALALVLAASLLAMLAGVLTSKGSVSHGVTERMATVGVVRAQAMASLSGTSVDVEALEEALSAAQGFPASAEWQAFEAATQDWLAVEQRWVGLSAQARDVADRLSATTTEVQGMWPGFEQEGTLGRPETVDLAQLLSAYQALAVKMSVLPKTGAMVSSSSDRAQVAAAFQRFRNSSLAAQEGLAMTRAWRAASATWGQVSPMLATLSDEAVADVLSQRSVALAKLASASDTWAMASSRIVAQGPGGMTKSAAFVALVSLALLLLVAWKQQRWHVLHARSVSERVDQAVADLVHDLSPLGRGDLTHRARVSELPVGVLAETVNRALGQLRQLVALSRTTAMETSSASLRANEATGVLVDSQRARLSTLESSSQDILRLIESVGAGASDAKTSKDLTGRALTAASSGQGAVASSIERIHDIQERVEEASSRAQRLVDSSNEIAGMALTLKEIAEQLEILGMQADLQASKAGDAGQGFKVVAREVQMLSEASGVHARHVSSLVETALSDLEALSASMKSAATSVNEGSRLTDVTHGAWEEVVSSLQELSACVDSLHESAQTQKDLASTLDERTRLELGQLESDSQNAQEASEATLMLVSSVQALEEAVSKFKA